MFKLSTYKTFLLLIVTIVPHAYAEDSIWSSKGQILSETEMPVPSFAPLIEKLAPSVVNISTEGQEIIKNPFVNSPFTQNEDEDGLKGNPFDFYFKGKPEKKRPFNSLGSGFVINEDGYIVTNFHVIEKATKITVSFQNDKTKYPAKVIGKDKKTDLALIKVDSSKKFQSVSFGDSDKMMPGDWVIAIGNPFHLDHTATVGIISAKSRKVGGPYDDFLQTDASINPGNSGGPLFNSRGEVIGVNTAIFSGGNMAGSGFNIGIGFAIPVNIVKSITNQLYSKGKVVRGWLGVMIQPVTEDVAKAFKLDNLSGALVGDILKDSPAEDAGVQRGDIIVGFNGVPVENNEDLPSMVAKTEVGKSSTLSIIRNGKPITLNLTVKELKEDVQEALEKEDTLSPTDSKFGLSVQELTPEIAKAIGLSDKSGVIVADVAQDSPAAKGMIARGDIILQIGDKSIKDLTQYRSAIKDLKSNEPVLFLIKRGQSTMFVTMKIDE